MQLTINKPDQTVIKDGIGIAPIDMSGMPEDVRIVQWQDIKGHEELEDATNVTIYDITPYQFMIDRYDAAADLIDNPPPPTPEESIEQNRLTAIDKRDTLMTNIVVHENLKLHGLPTVYKDDQILEMENQIRYMQTVAEYPPDTPFDFPVEPAPPTVPDSPTSTSIDIKYNQTDTEITGVIVVYPDDVDPSTLTLQAKDESDTVIAEEPFTEQDGVWKATLTSDISVYTIVYLTVNDNEFTVPMTDVDNTHAIYLYH